MLNYQRVSCVIIRSWDSGMEEEQNMGSYWILAALAMPLGHVHTNTGTHGTQTIRIKLNHHSIGIQDADLSSNIILGINGTRIDGSRKFQQKTGTELTCLESEMPTQRVSQPVATLWLFHIAMENGP